MAAFSQNQIQELLVSGSGVSYSNNTRIDDLNDGEVAAYSPEGLKIIEDGNTPGTNEIVAGDVDRFFLAQGRGSGEEPIVSDIIDLRNVKATRVKTGSAPQQQHDYLGYDGSSGSIDAQNDQLYMVRLQIAQHITSNHGGVYTKHGQYNTDASATQEEIALNIAKSLHFNQEREPQELYRAGAINDASVTASNDLDESLVISKGSNKVFLDTAIQNGGTLVNNAATDYGGLTSSADGTDLAVGDYIRIEGDGVAVSTTTDVYRVEAINEINTGGQAEVTLDREVVQDDQIITGGDGAGTQVIPSGSIGSNWGVRIYGQSLTHQIGKKPLDPINQVRWKLSTEGFGSTDYNQAQAANLGNGAAEEVADLEWFAQGNKGEIYRTGEPNIFSPRQDVVISDGPYDMVHIVHEDVSTSNFTHDISRKVTTWAVPNSTPDHADYNAGTDRLTDVLEDLIGAGATVINDTVTSSETFSDIT